MLQVTDTNLEGVKIIEPKFFNDSRGFLFESFRLNLYQKIGIKLPFVQDNISRSRYGTLRGLHYQFKFPQGKLVTIIRGKVFDVAVDIRHGSPTFGKWIGVILDDENHKQIYIPPGFAHGFCVLSEQVDFCYKCTDYYHFDDAYGIAWDDPTISIKWPLTIKPILSLQDKKYSFLANMSPELLPKFNKKFKGN